MGPCRYNVLDAQSFRKSNLTIIVNICSSKTIVREQGLRLKHLSLVLVFVVRERFVIGEKVVEYHARLEFQLVKEISVNRD